MEDVRVHFVIPADCTDENDCSEEMQQAFVTCEQHRGSGFSARWVREGECTGLETLNKKDVFVLQDFKGKLFENLCSTKCLIIGARCLSCCWMEGSEIPAGPEPVYSVAMRGLKVTASGFQKSVKDSIKEKVVWMGGAYSDALRDDTTHLVCDKALSDKYLIAAEKNLPIMSASWVSAVWEASLKQNVNGSSPQFDGHKLPVFSKLQVTCSGIGKREKDKIASLINENGGEFTGAFKSDSTDIVILQKEGVSSDKYKAAQEFGKSCVLPAWVQASVERRHAQPPQQYRVAGASTSSPLSGGRPPDMSLNFSRITNVKPPNNVVDETQATDCSSSAARNLKMPQESKRSNECNSFEKDVVAAVDSFDMSQVKKAGPLFDGFCMYVCGLEAATRERVCALVSRAGGVRYSSPHERVTHTLAGSRAAAAAARAALPAVPVLSPLWLLHSIAAGAVLNEAEYLVSESSPGTADSRTKSSRKAVQSSEPSSPMSKRNLQLLRLAAPGSTPAATPSAAPARPPVPKFDLDPPPDDESIVQQYLAAAKDNDSTLKRAQSVVPEVGDGDRSAGGAGRGEESDLTDEPTEDLEPIFADVRFELQRLEESSAEVVAGEVERAGGRVVSAGCGGEYVLVPLNFDPSDAADGDAALVTIFWLKDCLSQRAVLEPQYYHRPVWVGAGAGAEEALAGVVLSISTYTGVERMFLDELAQLLGATTQLRFCRRTTSTSRASTHLLCPEPRGDKYAGAVKWGLPAVSARWLLACAAAARRVHEQPYIVGETRAPLWKDSIEECAETSASDKENMTATVVPPAAASPAHAAPAALAAPAAPPPPARDNTPLKKIKAATDGEGEMSPASRYIAMARQGLLGADSQETPKRLTELKKESLVTEASMRTPPLEEALATPNLRCLSPTTRRRLQAIKRGEMPSDPVRTPTNPFDANVVTPDSGFGAALRPAAGRMSPESRKQLWSLVQELPGAPQPPPHPNPQSTSKDTPLSEICNRYLSRYNPHGSAPPRKLDIDEQAETPPAKIAKTAIGHFVSSNSIGNNSSSLASMDKQLQQLSSLVEAHSSRMRRSSAATPRPATPPHLLEPPGNSSSLASMDKQLQQLSSLVEAHSSRMRRSSAATLRPATPPHLLEPPGNSSFLASMDKQLQQLSSLVEAHSSRMRRSSAATPRPATPPHLEPPGNSSSLASMDKQLQQLSSFVEAHSSRMRRSSAATPRPATPPHLLEPPDAVRTGGPDSQVNTVGWDDSSQLRLVTSGAADVAPPPPQPSPPPQTPPAPPKHKRFMLSSNVENREELAAMVVSLAGSVSCSEGVDAEVTHLLCAAPSRSERVLGSVAAGKWLLHPLYIARSHTAGHFLDEEEYEWGNEKATSLPALEASEARLARAAHRWRAARAAGRPGPFHGMRVVLHVSAARRATLARLLLAGGGAVLDVRPPYGCSECTHCFAELRKCPMERRDMLFFVQRRVPVCPPVSLTSYLEEEEPRVQDHCTPEYRALYEQIHAGD